MGDADDTWTPVRARHGGKHRAPGAMRDYEAERLEREQHCTGLAVALQSRRARWWESEGYVFARVARGKWDVDEDGKRALCPPALAPGERALDIVGNRHGDVAVYKESV